MCLSAGRALRLRTAKAWIVVGALASLGLVAVCAVMLIELRQDAWDKAEQNAKNLLQVIERDIGRNVEIIGLSLLGLAENLATPGLMDLAPGIRQRVLFDRAVHADDLGVMLALDENGDVAFDAARWPARRLNSASRAYFQAHKADPNLGLHISPPLISQLTRMPVVVLSRRIDKPDGSFGGIVLGSLALSYFDRLFERIKIGRAGTINLFLQDGTRIVRYPVPEQDFAPNFANAPNFLRFQRERAGSFVAATHSDGVERLYAFTQIGNLPLILNVALSTREIEAEWRAKAVVIGGIVLALCSLTIGLSVLVGRELQRRAVIEAELACLSRTDALTALPNRRAFEETFERAYAEARSRGGPVTLLVVDADHFKRYNDRYGHPVGDRVLQSLARAMRHGARRRSDLVARIGGEEFAVLLPGADAERAARAAEAIHEAVAGIVVPVEGGDVGAITVSIGLAYGLPARDGAPAELLQLADAVLYEAKATGRNRTCYAVMGLDGGRSVLPPARMPVGGVACAI